VSKPSTNSSGENHQRNEAGNVLIVASEPELVRFLLETLARKGLLGTVARDQKTAVSLLEKEVYALAFVSSKTPVHSSGSSQPKNSLGLLGKIRTISPQTQVVMIADAGPPGPQDSGPPRPRQRKIYQTLIETAVSAIRAGCYDFLVNPFETKKIENLLDTFLPNHPVQSCASCQDGSRSLYNIVGRSPKLTQTMELARKIAVTSAPVLISGESGTGKEMLSFFIHHQSKRSLGPYIRLNCAALSETLLESELFGHEKGAFTGACALRRGRFEMAHGGTLLLDEISETPLRFQAKLLRVLEQQDFERVGGEKRLKLDVRIISTTNKNLLDEIQRGRFRQDLYYRLTGVRLIVPPLSQRREDLPDLVWHFVNLYAYQSQRHITRLDTAMMDIFAKYQWPGNVRQLRNVVLTSLILGSGQTLSLAEVSWLFETASQTPPMEFAGGTNELQPPPQSGQYTGDNGYEQNTLRCSGLAGLPLEQVERQAILETLRQSAGNQTKAAKVLGISDRTLRDKIRRYRQQECLQGV